MIKDQSTPRQETDIVTRDANGTWGTPRTLLKGGDIALWSPDGRQLLIQLQAGEGRNTLALIPVGGGAPKIITPPVALSDGGYYSWAWSPDGRDIYYIARQPGDPRTCIWRLPAAGGTPRPMAWFDDPALSFNRTWLRTRGKRIYFTMGSPQSDVWMAELSGRR
jgi:dipeptidyl aminopeptidase/acylaminoacyl peptidase